MGALAPVYLHVAGRSHANPLMAGGGKATACPSHRVLRMPTQQSMRTHMSNQHIDPSDNSAQALSSASVCDWQVLIYEPPGCRGPACPEVQP